MAQLALGIDIGDDILSAVVIEGAGKDAKVLSHAFRLRERKQSNDVTEEISEILQALGHPKVQRCAVGISLSHLSLRNLLLPFQDSKKIEQILSFELEDQLLLPFEAQILAATYTAVQENQSIVLAASVEKSLLSEYLAAFHANGLEPERIFPTTFILADRLSRVSHIGNTFLLLCGDLCAMQMVLLHEGEVLFMRPLPWPDTVFTHSIFSYEEQKVKLTEAELLEEVSKELCDQIQRSIDYFCFQNSIHIQPDYFVLTGPIQLCNGVLSIIEEKLELTGRLGDLVWDSSIVTDMQWQPAFHDSALALALQAGQRSKDLSLNFRKGEFAVARKFFRSKKQLIGTAVAALLLLGLGLTGLGMDVRKLQQQHTALSSEMERLFRESFPGIQPGPDPLMHMRSRLRTVDTSTVAAPIFTEEKRVIVLLTELSARIPQSIDVKLNRIIIDQQSMRINGTTDAFNNVNIMQRLLSNSDRYSEVTIISATKGRQDDDILFEIRMILREV